MIKVTADHTLYIRKNRRAEMCEISIRQSPSESDSIRLQCKVAEETVKLQPE